MKVLIGCDGMTSEVDCVHAAANRPWPPGSSFCLLHVFNPYLVVETLEAAAKPLRNAGLETKTEIIAGSPRKDISRFAKEWKADLIMVGCNDLSDLGRFLLGSTARSVVRHAPCSVEVVRPRRAGRGDAGSQAGMRILIGTDGSDCSVAALQSVAARPWPAETVAKVISVPEFILFKDPSYLEEHEVKDLSRASTDDATRCINAGVEILASSGLKVSSEVPAFEERPYRVILHEADCWNADLVVVGSHGRSGFDRVVMGSVSEAVSLHAACSVEVIRPREAS